MISVNVCDKTDFENEINLAVDRGQKVGSVKIFYTIHEPIRTKDAFMAPGGAQMTIGYIATQIVVKKIAVKKSRENEDKKRLLAHVTLRTAEGTPQRPRLRSRGRGWTMCKHSERTRSGLYFTNSIFVQFADSRRPACSPIDRWSAGSRRTPLD